MKTERKPISTERARLPARLLFAVALGLCTSVALLAEPPEGTGSTARSDAAEVSASTVELVSQPASAAASSAAVWDPVLRQFREPRGAELAILEQKVPLARTSPPVVERLPDGTKRFRVAERAFAGSWGHSHPDGSVTAVCAPLGEHDHHSASGVTAVREE